MIKKIFFSIFTYALGVFLLASCSSSEDTTPSMADKDRMEELIDTDIAKIKQFRDDYGTYILYNFDKKLDFAYQFEQASSWDNATLISMSKAEASATVDYLYDNVFNCYSDEYKKRMYPRKLLLVKDIQSNNELGMSQPVAGHHVAVANINSVTVAYNGEDKSADYHRALIADYLVKARGQYPVGEAYYSYSKAYYSSLMNNNRKNARQLLAEDPNFFYDRGFFFPDDDEATYFPSTEDDVLSYIREMIAMDKTEADRLLDMPVMADKMHLIAIGLQEMGIDVVKINPWAEQFVTMEYIQPAVVFANDVVSATDKADIEITVVRGSKPLDRLVVSVNEKEQTIDLKPYDRMRIVLHVALSGLRKGQNIVTMSLYEDGMEHPSVTSTASATYADMENISGFKIDMDEENEEITRTIKVYEGEGYPVDKTETNPDLTTITFEKRGWMDRYYNENDCDYRAWKLYKKDGMVTKIMAYERGFNDDFTDIIYKLTHTYEFAYNADNELETVKKTDVDGMAETIVTDVAYMSGRIVRYNYCGKVYEPVYATANGAMTRVDCLDAEMSGLCFGFTGNEYMNPYYMPGLPAVIPGDVAEVPLQLLYSQYIFNSLGTLWTDGWQTVQEGNAMAKQARVVYGGCTWTYTFALKTETKTKRFATKTKTKTKR